MSTIREYITFRGDLSFQERPFGEVDYVILCEMTYLNMKQGFLGNRESFRAIIERILSQGELEPTNGIELEMRQRIYQELADSTRFGELILTDYVDVLDTKEEVQFAAAVWQLTEDLQCIVFRGTDASVVGWKEDFEITYTRPKAQLLAVDYLKKQLSSEKNTIIAGHSKGGNLAQYAINMLNEKEAAAISHVYMFDSPGLCRDFLENTECVLPKERFTRLVPEYCVVGNIFYDTHNERKFIRSLNKGVMQHDMISWCIDGLHFEYAEQLAPSSERINHMLNQLLQELSLEERQRFVDALFQSIERAGITSFLQFTEEGVSSFENVLLQLIRNEYCFSKEFLSKPLHKAGTVEIISRVFHRFKRLVQKKLFQSCGLIIAGIIFCLLPKSIITVMPALLLVLVTILEVLYTVYSLKKSHFDFRKENIRISFSILLVVITTIVIMKNNALFLIGSMVFGTLFLEMSIFSLRTLNDYKKKSTGFYIQIMKGVLYAIFGMFILIAPENTVEWYSYSVGGFLMLHGVIGIVGLIIS